MNPYTTTLWIVGSCAAFVTGLLAIAASQSYGTDALALAGWVGVLGQVALLSLVAACVVSGLRWQQPEAQAEPTTTATQPAPHTDADGL
ncbi:MAG TPA: hypothetical protein VL043_00600 [Protaetiibacter sp.]|nr:hypothetical protein [Protaetiibacter sp.]